MSDAIAWPQKAREYFHSHIDSTVWNDFAFRGDDIVIATYAKSGTTWMQQIVSQLIFSGEEGLDTGTMSPWLDFAIMPQPATMEMLEAQQHRRFVKTHLPLDALVFSPSAKYLYIARDGRDVLWSWYNHYLNTTDATYALINDRPGRFGPPFPRMPDDPVTIYRQWLAEDGAPFWPFWEHVRSWWSARDLPNVELVHFSNLKDDLEGAMRRIAAFLDIEVPDDLWPTLVEHCSFDYMRGPGAAAVPGGGVFWEGGAKTFLHKGTNGRWRDRLSEQDAAEYEAKAEAELGRDCAHWLATGAMPG